MAQLFSPATDNWLRMLIGAVLVVSVIGLTGLLAFARSAYNTGQSYVVEQPIPFSHKHHVADCGIDCRYCHTSVTEAATAGMPSTATCLRCHRYLFKQSQMLKPVHESWQNKQPLQWNRVHDLPDYVYFNHSIHLDKGIGCYSCHGRVDRMPLTQQVAPLTMQWCLDCHRNPTDHVRPKTLLYDTRPLEELVHTLDKPSDPSGPRSEKANSDGAALSLHTVREQLAARYGVKSHTDCYTCHR